MTVVEKGEKHLSKYKMSFAKAVQGEAGKLTALPYQGRMILFERKGDKYAASAEGEPALAAKDLEPLVNKANDQRKEHNSMN